MSTTYINQCDEIDQAIQQNLATCQQQTIQTSIAHLIRSYDQSATPFVTLLTSSALRR